MGFTCAYVGTGGFGITMGKDSHMFKKYSKMQNHIILKDKERKTSQNP